ncbi:bifunctional ornithine acetyltransferase/N-acetylglutamate synthase [Neisseria gonorrhoeae]
MAVNLTEKTAEQLPDIDGIALYTAQAGVKKPGHTDLTLIAVAAGSTVGAVFTTNRFCAAPVHIAKSHLFDEDGVRATGIAKGSGMIHPNMATMLGFIATDAKVSQPVLQLMTQEIADETFNTITVDGGTSTNDSFVIIATGKNSQSEIDNIADPRYAQLKELLCSLALELAQAIVRDGEGATKFITVRVENAKTCDEARQAAYAAARSPLVKTAFFASDPNLGRLLAAIGYADVADLDTDLVEMYLDDILVAEHGGRAASYTEAQGQAVMSKDEITVRIKLHRGQAAATVYTCDLSHGYVSINADYRS